jgi:hypothetical protein
MDIYNVSNPVQPIHLATVKTPPFVGSLDIWSVIISGSYAFLTDGYYGVYVIDISDPVNPSIKAHATTQGFAPNLAVGDGYIYVCDQDSGLRIFQAENYASIPEEREIIPLFPTEPPTIELPTNFYIYKDKGSFHSVDIIKDMVVIAAGDEGLHLVQLKSQMPKINTLELDNFSFALDVSVWNENIFLAESNGLKIWTINESNQFVKKGSYYSSAYKVEVLSNNRAILAVNDYRIHVLDTSDPANPEMISNFLLPQFIQQICPTVFNQHYACIANMNGFTVIDLENSNDPIQYTSYEHSCYGCAIYEDGSNTIGYFVGWSGLHIYDMKQESPNLISHINLSDLNIEFYGNLTIENSMLILSSWDEGSFAIFDISNPVSPTLKAVYYTDFNCGPASYHNSAYMIPNGRGGLLFVLEEALVPSLGLTTGILYIPTMVLDGKDCYETELEYAGVYLGNYYFKLKSAKQCSLFVYEESTFDTGTGILYIPTMELNGNSYKVELEYAGYYLGDMYFKLKSFTPK